MHFAHSTHFLILIFFRAHYHVLLVKTLNIVIPNKVFHTPYIFLSPAVSYSLVLFVCFILLTNFFYILFIFNLFFFFVTFTISYFLAISSLQNFSFFYTFFYLFPFLLSLSPLLFIHSYLFQFIFIPIVCKSVKPFSQISLVSLKFTDAADNPSIFPFFF